MTMKLGRGPHFQLPPPAAPDVPAGEAEQSHAPDVMIVVQEHTVAARAETRLVRQELKEVLMKVAELSGKVDTLISVATSIKQTADHAAGVPSIPEDDPEVEALARRIDDAIAVLQGNSPAPAPAPSPFPVPVDPNAPLIP